jgi:hypothetical protein
MNLLGRVRNSLYKEVDGNPGGVIAFSCAKSFMNGQEMG